MSFEASIDQQSGALRGGIAAPHLHRVPTAPRIGKRVHPGPTKTRAWSEPVVRRPPASARTGMLAELVSQSESLVQPTDMTAPPHVHPLVWEQAIGIARDACARTFKNGGSPAHVLSQFRLDPELVQRWDQAVRTLAYHLCARN